jgi:hypothetical protein
MIAMNRTAKTVSLLAFVAGATALLYRPASRLIERLRASRRARRASEETPQPGEFANHYLGSNRHHSRADKHHASVH